MVTLAGKYTFESPGEVDQYLAALGVGQVLRKVRAVARPTVEVAYMPDTDEYQITTISAFSNETIKFKLGYPFEDRTYDARNCRTTARIGGDNKIIFEQTCDEGPPVTVTYEVKAHENDGQGPLLVVTMKSGDHQVIQTYRVGTATPTQAQE